MSSIQQNSHSMLGVNTLETDEIMLGDGTTITTTNNHTCCDFVFDFGDLRTKRKLNSECLLTTRARKNGVRGAGAFEIRCGELARSRESDWLYLVKILILSISASGFRARAPNVFMRKIIHARARGRKTLFLGRSSCASRRDPPSPMPK